MDTTFLKDITESAQTTPSILLIDSSGSVKQDFVNGMSIFDKFQEIISKINNDNFRFIFWNSDRQNDNIKNFPKGIISPSTIVKKSTSGQLFTVIKSKITNQSLTFPHIGFSNINKDWIDNKTTTHIYFLTDGMMGYNAIPYHELFDLKKKLSESFEYLFKKFNNIHLHIIAVENTKKNYDDLELLQTTAGNDVFKTLQDAGLTKYITEYISYAPNYQDGFSHIKNIIPPEGFIPYNTVCFSQLDTHKFIQYIYNIVKDNKDKENELLKIVQYLSQTIRVLIKDKSKHMADMIVNTFCNIFNNTVLDQTIVTFMLADTIELENQGKAIIFAEYRSKLKDLYKRAQQLLTQNVKNSINMNGKVMTFPINNKIILTNHNYITDQIKLAGNTYPNSSIKVNDFILPVVPVINKVLTPLNEQCLRQYIRSIISVQFSVNPMDDSVIYIVMALMLKAVISPDVSDEIKTGFRNLATVMLKKKRLNTDMTELNYIENGNILPNDGKIESFYNYMKIVNNILGINTKPMTTWYALCLALNNDLIISKQLILCSDSIKSDCDGLEKQQDLLTNFSGFVDTLIVGEIQQEAFFDYTCIVSLDDTSLVGGYKIKEHDTITGSLCTPNFVVSEDGHKLLIANHNIMCPICYSLITPADFEQVGPKPAIDMNLLPVGTVNPYLVVHQPVIVQPVGNSKGTLVLMHGTVGAGKSTFSLKLQKMIEKIGGNCINEGTDKYCKNGTNGKAAANIVTNELKKAFNVKNEINVVIVDTCGEKGVKNNTVFNVNFTGWKVISVYPNYNKNKLKEYLAWSLRNVLNRAPTDATSNYWLNPTGAGVKTCIDVHYNKAKALLHIKDHVTKAITKDQAIEEINKDADEYAKYLKDELDIDIEVQKVIDKILS